MLTYQLDPYESHDLINIHSTEIASFVADLAGPITTISIWRERAGNDIVAVRNKICV